jgi:hypothetical protein
MFIGMDKPIVFLSHSSKNKEELAVLKELLQEKSVGAIEFFLSSDGQSVKFGSNWVARISEALDKAKVMFVFVSPESAASKWIHFEAGCAYSKGIRVVPICLPGIELNQVHPPLALLQGFNLHSSDALNNIPAICNQVFGLSIPGNFSDEDFRKAFHSKADSPQNYFGPIASFIDTIHVRVRATRKDLDILINLYKQRASEFDLNETVKHAGTGSAVNVISFQSYGIELQAEFKELTAVNNFGFTLSAELFAINAKLLNSWNHQVGGSPFRLDIGFHGEVDFQRRGQKRTTRIYGTGIQIAEDGQMKFGDLKFDIVPSSGSGCFLTLHALQSLEHDALPLLVTKLFESEVFFLTEDL